METGVWLLGGGVLLGLLGWWGCRSDSRPLGGGIWVSGSAAGLLGACLLFTAQIPKWQRFLALPALMILLVSILFLIDAYQERLELLGGLAFVGLAIATLYYGYATLSPPARAERLARAANRNNPPAGALQWQTSEAATGAAIARFALASIQHPAPPPPGQPRTLVSPPARGDQ